MDFKLLKISKYVLFHGTQEEVSAIRRSGAKIDPMGRDSTSTSIRVAEWVPAAVKMYRENDGYAGMSLEDFLRITLGRRE